MPRLQGSQVTPLPCAPPAAEDDHQMWSRMTRARGCFSDHILKARPGWVARTESQSVRAKETLATTYSQPSFSPAEETDIPRKVK